MDTIGSPSKREILRLRVEEAQTALHDAANAGLIKNDPLCQHLSALALLIGASYEMHCAAEEARHEIAESSVRRHTEIISKGVLDTVRMSLDAMTKELGPQLLKAALPTMRQTVRTLRIRSVLGVSGTLLILLLFAGAYLYTAGVTLGRTQGEDSGHAMQAAMKYSPEGALIWGKLMTYNDPAKAMALCEKDITVGPGGRRSCYLPVWIDPIPGTTP